MRTLSPEKRLAHVFFQHVTAERAVKQYRKRLLKRCLVGLSLFLVAGLGWSQIDELSRVWTSLMIRLTHDPIELLVELYMIFAPISVASLALGAYLWFRNSPVYGNFFMAIYAVTIVVMTLLAGYVAFWYFFYPHRQW